MWPTLNIRWGDLNTKKTGFCSEPFPVPIPTQMDSIKFANELQLYSIFEVYFWSIFVEGGHFEISFTECLGRHKCSPTGFLCYQSWCLTYLLTLNKSSNQNLCWIIYTVGSDPKPTELSWKISIDSCEVWFRLKHRRAFSHIFVGFFLFVFEQAYNWERWYPLTVLAWHNATTHLHALGSPKRHLPCSMISRIVCEFML